MRRGIGMLKVHRVITAVLTFTLVLLFSNYSDVEVDAQSPKPGKSRPHRLPTITESGQLISTTPTPLCPTPTLAPVLLPLYGVTIQSIENNLGDLRPIADSLKGLHYKPTVRLVFNKWGESKEKNGDDTRAYKTAASALRGCGYVMGELLDSYNMRGCDIQCYERRAQRYVTAMGDDVDIWEVGNEVNGNWARRHKDSKDPEVIRRASMEVGEKVYRAFKIAETAGKPTALTLYYNDDGKGGVCWEREQDKMLDWAKNYVNPEMKKEGALEYVLISYYDDKGHCRDNETGEMLSPDWQKDFEALAKEFPHAKVGFGERGTKCQDGEKATDCIARKARYVNSVYGLWVDNPDYIGGFFWWYFKEDMVPATNSLWQVLNGAIKKGPQPQSR